MKRPCLNEKTAVKIIDRDCLGFGQRGTVAELLVSINGVGMISASENRDAIKEAYIAGLGPKMEWHVRVKFPGSDELCLFKADQVEPVQHKFMDIDYIREDDLDLGTFKEDGTKIIRPKNTCAFEPGDIISISTKIDGANASISWDTASEKLEVFSRTNLLTSPGSLRGFYDYIKAEVEPKFTERMKTDFKKLRDYVLFGEWCVSHTVQYNKDWYGKWRIYDIWDKEEGRYLLQDAVHAACDDLGLEYIEELYRGPFISWDHCRSFLTKSTAYGPQQEGVVIKNQSKIGVERSNGPIYIKIVDEKFKEHMDNKGHKAKQPEDPEVAAAKKKAEELIASVATEARVKKLICKLVDEGILPSELSPRDMGTCMKHLPKMVFDDLLKEEPEVVKAAGEYAGKTCSAIVSKHAKAIVIGK